MENERRALLLKVHAGNDHVLGCLMLINDMVRADDVLRLLIKRGCVGHAFEEWVNTHCFVQDVLRVKKIFSPKRFYELLVQSVEKSTNPRTLVLMKDIHGQ